jgi:hypothetical protein
VSVLGPGASPQVLASKARPSSKLARKARITPPANPVKSEGYFTTSITPPGWGVRRVIPSVPRLLPPHCLWVSVANPSASPSESHPYDLAPPNSHGITSLRKNRGGGYHGGQRNRVRQTIRPQGSLSFPRPLPLRALRVSACPDAIGVANPSPANLSVATPSLPAGQSHVPQQGSRLTRERTP